MEAIGKLCDVAQRGVKFSPLETAQEVKPFLKVFNSQTGSGLDLDSMQRLMQGGFIDLAMQKVADIYGSEDEVTELIAIRAEQTMGVIDAEEFVWHGWEPMFSYLKKPLEQVAKELSVGSDGSVLSYDGIDALLNLKAIIAASTMTMLFV